MKIIGHRGARGLASENTLESLRRALAAGADEIEIDVRVTKDNVPVLNHDPFLNDANGNQLRRRLIHEHTLAELRSLRSDLATLDEAVALVGRQVPMLIEVKPKVATGSVIEALQLYLDKGWRETDFLLASFSQRTLLALHDALPGIEMVVSEHLSAFIATRRARALGAKRLLFNQHNLWWFLIRSLTQSGFHVMTYTLNNRQKAARWSKHGLYGVITDYPDLFITEPETSGPAVLATPRRHATRHTHPKPHSKKRRTK
jgi:glycerophosphoryl diester phosphodiesterase